MSPEGWVQVRELDRVTMAFLVLQSTIGALAVILAFALGRPAVLAALIPVLFSVVRLKRDLYRVVVRHESEVER